jgi:hypothetical protein
MKSTNFTELVLNIIYYLHSKPNLRHKTNWTWDSGTVWVIFNHNQLSADSQTFYTDTIYIIELISTKKCLWWNMSTDR